MGCSCYSLLVFLMVLLFFVMVSLSAAWGWIVVDFIMVLDLLVLQCFVCELIID